tara:strand:- start:23594 stop:23791 length:198 start_codon:yes stop_codon:yes gene_type:complete
MEYLKKFDVNEEVGYVPNWRIHFMNRRGDSWTSSLSGMDLLDVATKIKNTMTEEEFKSIHKIVKY